MHSPLLTDLYQLTMGQGCWANGMAEREAVFHLSFRRAPFGEVGAVAAGLGPAIEFLAGLKFNHDEIDFLASLKGADEKPLFDSSYLDYLQQMEWKLNVSGVSEGELVFPHEPLLRIQGPMLQCQLVETALLNIMNFQTLVATKAARICEAAGDDLVLEFGLRRAQGPDGGMSASRAAYIGGCAATSNVLAGQRFGIPVKGTHAHSWVMSFDKEIDAFRAYAEAMPNNSLLLVDTYDTLNGVRNAIRVGHELRERGHDLLGVRLDSGDLASLSRDARQLLDDAGFHDAKIVASNDLHEDSIRELKAAGARIDIWGVGTMLATAYSQPALGGVYKLGAIRDEVGKWKYRVKLSNDMIKVSNPGVLQVERTRHADGSIECDRLFNETDAADVVDESQLLLQEVIREGKIVHFPESLAKIRERASSAWRLRPRDGESPVILDSALEQTKRRLLEQNGFKP